MWALGRLPAKDAAPALPGLRNALRDPSWAAPINAAATLGRLGDKAAAAQLRRALGSTSAPLRASAALALGRIGDAAARAELTRLLAADTDRYVRAFAERHGVVLVLKGARTVVATPDGRISVNPTGNAGLASGGTGDVLTGIIGALLAQGLAAGDAARLGVYLHGLAADRVVATHGGELLGLLASDLLSELPHTLAAARAQG